MFQLFFSPHIQTIYKAANKNQLQGIPYLNSSKIVKKILGTTPSDVQEAAEKAESKCAHDTSTEEGSS